VAQVSQWAEIRRRYIAVVRDFTSNLGVQVEVEICGYERETRFYRIDNSLAKPVSMGGLKGNEGGASERPGNTAALLFSFSPH